MGLAGGDVLRHVIVSAVDAECGAPLLLAECWWDVVEDFVIHAHSAVSAIREDLQAIERLPHANRLTSFWYRPNMMRPECPVIQGHFAHAILDADSLTADEEHLLCPVVLHWVHARLCFVCALMSLCADTLVDTECIPWKVVNHPEGLALVNYLAFD